MKQIKVFFAIFCFAALFGASHAAVNLTGVAAVNVTSDTAAVAKNMAMDEARQQIITDILSQYSNSEQLRAALQNAAGSELANLISASSIDGEKLSDTTYSANITMTLDSAAARTWLNEKGVQNWLPDAARSDMFTVIITLSDAMADWMGLNQIARREKIDIATKYIMGNQITAEMPSASRAAFTIALREAGWHYSNQDGLLRIWK